MRGCRYSFTATINVILLQLKKRLEKNPVSYHQHVIGLISKPHHQHELMARANVDLIESFKFECG